MQINILEVKTNFELLKSLHLPKETAQRLLGRDTSACHDSGIHQHERSAQELIRHRRLITFMSLKIIQAERTDGRSPRPSMP